MALVLKDRVKETTTTVGTGSLTLLGAVVGYQAFSVIGNGNTCYYAISSTTGNEWEVGIGTYTSSGTSLSRDTILSSSSSGSVVNLSAGTKDVYVVYPAEKAVYEDSANKVVQSDFVNLDVSGTATLATATITAGTVSTTPASATDIANKQYVDTLVSSGITYHQPVKYEVPNTTGNLNATYSNGASGVGATLTNAGTLAAFAPDGPTASQFDRILVYNQTNAFENGVYEVTTVGSGSVAWVLTRTTDADSYGLKDTNALGNGDAFFVTSGNTGAGETYVCNTTGVITFGTTAITFAQISDSKVYSAGTGLTLSGTQFSITPVGTASTYGSASQVPVLTTNASGQVSSVTNTNIAIAASQITSGTLPAIYGGTGQSSYAVGDLLYADTTTTLAKLADVATGNVLLSGGTNTAPSYGKVGLGTHISGTLAVSNGGTGLSTLTAHGVLYASTTSAFSQDANFTYSGSTLSAPSLSLSSNLTFTGTGNRITGDFSNATIANRVAFQTSTTNGSTTVSVLPNGTGTATSVSVFNNSDPTNASFFGLISTSTEGRLNSSITGTGSYLPLTMFTGGSERLRIDTSGNVGIGLTNPSTPLDVYGAINVRSGYNVQWGTSANYIAANTSLMQFGVNSAERMRIDSSGNVGIGVTPSQRLDVGGTSQPIIRAISSSTNNATARMFSDGDTVYFGSQNTSTTGGNVPVVFQISGTERMRIDSSGNVGIGTGSPNTKLTVVGAMNFGANVSAPAVDAGIFRPADGTLAFVANASERMRIDSSGNLILGTTAVAAAEGYRFYKNYGRYDNGTFTGFIGSGTSLGSAAASDFSIRSENALAFMSGGATERMRIDSSGNVGIGTASPTSKLTVAGDIQVSSTNYLNFSNTAQQTYIRAAATSTMAFGTDSTERMRIDSSGNVGIGTSSPAYKLVVSNAGAAGIEFDPSSGLIQTYNRSGTAYTSMLLYALQTQFYTGSSPAERMRITSNGGISFGSTGTAYGVQNAALISNGDTTPTWNQVASLGSFFYQTAFMGGF